jgi:predicted MFS family arabinose efflux permease
LKSLPIKRGGPESIGRNAQHSDETGSSRQLTSVGLIVGGGYFVIGLVDPCGGFARLPVQFVLKDWFHFSPAQMATFFGLAMLAWYLKPVFGLICDSFRLWGTRRRHYLITVVSCGLLCWVMIGLVSLSPYRLLALVVVLSGSLAVVSTVLGGIVVEEGQRRAATGRLSSLRQLADNLAYMTGGLIGGLLVTRSFIIVGAAGAGLLLVFLLAVLFRFTEASASAQQVGGSGWVGQLRQLFLSKGLWAAVSLWCLVRLTPGLQTVQFFFQSERLGFEPSFIGLLTFVGGACGVLGAVTYAYICRRLSLRVILYVTIVVDVAVTLLYLGYTSRTSALVIDSANAFVFTLAFLPFLDFVARSAPRGCEAAAYALVFSIGNLASSVSDILGSWLVTACQFDFYGLVWVNAGTTAAVLLLIPLLPPALVSGRDSGHS